MPCESMMRDSRTKYCRLALTLILTIFCAGCCYIPPRGRQTSEKDLATIKVGMTTKARVVELLGKPDILEDERFYVCTAGKNYGGFILFGAAVIFDVAASRPLWRFVPKDSPFHGVTGNDAINAWAFGPDGKSFVTASNNGVYCWELPPSE